MTEESIQNPPRKRLYKSNSRRASGVAATEQGLTIAQEAYCRARAMGMSPKEACVAAGNQASFKMALAWESEIPAVSARIRELSSIASKNAIIKTGLDRQWVISRLMSVADRCMQAEEVKDKRGDPTGEYRFDSIGATRALELLGKTLNMFDGGKNPLDDAYEHLSDDDLARIASELAAKTGVLAGIARAQQEAGARQAIEIQAVPETAGVSLERSDVPRTSLSSWQPVGEDVEFSVRNSDSSDGAVP
jgi:phage terminase small subunit